MFSDTGKSFSVCIYHDFFNCHFYQVEYVRSFGNAEKVLQRLFVEYRYQLSAYAFSSVKSYL